MDVFFTTALAVAVLCLGCAFLFFYRLRMAESYAQSLAGERDAAIEARLTAEREHAKAQQKLADMTERMTDWETMKRETVNAATAAAIKTGHDLSSKLLEDHKREMEAAKKDGEERTKQATAQLTEQFKVVTERVAALNHQNEHHKNQLSTLWRTLSSPAGAGQLSEIGLENSLKRMGLESPRDFIMQYALKSAAGSLRPDCVIFLPQEHVMVIDSKASKFLLEIAEAEDGVEKTAALERLKRTMNEHLKALASKDYRGAVQSYYRECGRSSEIRHIFSVMYVPTESALAHLKQADPEFLRKAEQQEIIIAGPASLYGLLSLSQIQIVEARKAENQQEIIEVTQDLLDALVTAFAYAEKAGKNFKGAAEQFDAFARSANRFVLSRMRKLTQMGVKPAKAKDLPTRLTTYEICVDDEIITLEAEEPKLKALA